MSRGHGKVQRACLEWMAQHSDEELWSLAEIAHDGGDRDDGRPTAAQFEATRRALGRLMDEGLVERHRKHYPGDGFARPPATVWVYRLSVGQEPVQSNTYEKPDGGTPVPKKASKARTRPRSRSTKGTKATPARKTAPTPNTQHLDGKKWASRRPKGARITDWPCEVCDDTIGWMVPATEQLLPGTSIMTEELVRRTGHFGREIPRRCVQHLGD